MINISKGSATIGATEFSLVSASTSLAAAITTGELHGWIDLANMAAGDQYQITIKDKINGGAQRSLAPSIVTGVQTGPFLLPGYIVYEGWDVTIKKLAGTDRAIPWSLRQRIEVPAVVGTAITGTLTATAFTTSLAATVDDTYKDCWVTFISGSLAGQSHQIGGYTGSSKTISIVSPKQFTGAPANGDTFLILNQ